MIIEHRRMGNTLFVSLSGELDEHSAAEVRIMLDSLPIETDRKVIYDLSDVQFMDSTGVGVLIGRYKILKNAAKQLILASPSAAINKLLTLSGIYDVIPKIVY